jgi:hypothetical protein
MTTIRSGSAALLAITLLAAGPAAAEESATPGQMQSGLVLQIAVNARLVNAFGNTNSTGPVVYGSGGVVDGGFHLGYKIDRVIVGAGIDLARIGTSTTQGSSSSSSSDTLVEIVPGIQVALARSADARVELYGGLDLGFGHVFVEGGTEPSNFAFRFAVGPGVRYWVHPQFAIAALTGLEGRFAWVTASGTVASQSESIHQLSILAGLRCLGVF